MHEFYAKYVSSKSVIRHDSALPDDVKRTVLTQEGLRRLRNCSRTLPWDAKAHHLTKFSKRLQFLIRSAIPKPRDSECAQCIRLPQKEDDRERPLYRPRTWNASERRNNKKAKKTEWFKKNGESTVLFVPPTPNSVLVKAL